MSQQILIISPCNVRRQELCDHLRALGYLADGAATLNGHPSSKHATALFILDLQLARQSDPEQWQAWLQDCKTNHTPCLVYDSSDQPHLEPLAQLEPLCDTFTVPVDQQLLSTKIRSLLTIRKLSRQLEATRLQLSRYQAEHQEGLKSAAHIQRSLIPTRQPCYHNLHYSWKYMPCRQVGGDLFNIVQLDEQTIMTYLLDVSGHGISSAMVTVSVHQSLSLHTGQLIKRPAEFPPFYEITPPGLVLRELDAEYPFERFEEFFTISYLLINPLTGQLRYSNAGHPPPLLLRCDGRTERLHAGGTLIGMGQETAFDEGETRLSPGDRLFIYTDGITEHFNKAGEAFGEGRLLEQLTAQAGNSIEEAIQNTLISLRKFGGRTLPIDDVTLIGMEFGETT